MNNKFFISIVNVNIVFNQSSAIKSEATYISVNISTSMQLATDARC